jgi:exosortase O
VKSLWTGGLFLLAATWIERRRINLRWVLVAVIFAVLLLAANLARVGVLVSVGQVAGWILVAEMLHVPLGVLGFAGACAAAVWLMGVLRVKREDQYTELPVKVESAPQPKWLPLAMGVGILVMGLIYTPRPQSTVQASPGMQFPDEMHAVSWQLTEQERDWLESSGIQAAERWRFDWRGLQGSLLLVTSSTWRAHHRPERCFEVYGLKQEEAYSHLVAADFPVRMLALSAGDERTLYSAAYWLQSSTQATDDYATRIWSDLAPERQPWMLVTILFDRPIDPRSADAMALYQTLREVVHTNLAGGSQ